MREETVQEIRGALNESNEGIFLGVALLRLRYDAFVTALHAFLLGLLQGFTELLPVSSSGHLALVEQYWQVSIPRGLLGFDVLLHVGSLCALLLCYPRLWARILVSPFSRDRDDLRLLLFLIVATIPAGIAGIFFGDFFDAMRSRTALGVGFLLSGIILIIAERFPGQRASSSLRLWEVIALGVAQVFALPPSVSRSGITMAAGRVLRLSRPEAVDFSFLMAVPAIAGASLFTAAEVWRGTMSLPAWPASIAGLLASFGASIMAIIFLRALVQRFSMAWFALYLFPLAVFLLAK